MKAVIAGATGLVGSTLLEKLFKDASFTEIISITRKPLREHPKLKQILIENFSELPPVTGDVHFCCLGTTIKTAGSKDNFRKVDFDAVLNFAKSAKNFILVSASGANAKSPIFYNRLKG